MDKPDSIENYLKKHDYFYQKINDSWHFEICLEACRLCGKRSVIQVKLLEATYDGQRERDRMWLAGGRNTQGHLLCDSCLNIAARYDVLKDLERKIELAMNAFHQIIDKVNELAEWVSKHER